MLQPIAQQEKIISTTFSRKITLSPLNQVQQRAKKSKSHHIVLNADQIDEDLMRFLFCNKNFQKLSFACSLQIKVDRLEASNILSLKQFTSTFFRFLSLRELDITLSKYGELNNEFFCFLKTLLSPHGQISCLKLQFVMFLELLDIHLLKISKIFLRFPLLMKLSVSLHYSDCTAYGLIRFGRKLSSLPKLKTFSLKLSGCHQIDDQALKDFTSTFIKLQQLSVLTLRFVYCPQITNDALAQIASKLQKLKHLTAFQFFISNSKIIDDTGLVVFAEALTKIPNIKDVSLFFGFTSISGQGIQKCESIFKNKNIELSISSS